MVGKQEILVCGQTVPDAGYTVDQAQMTPEVEGVLWSQGAPPWCGTPP